MIHRRIHDASVVVALVAISVAACSSQGNGTNPGDSVVIAGTSHVIWRSAGDGFGPILPAAAPCHRERTYDLDLGGSLAWNVCRFAAGADFNDPTAYSTVTGSRTLTGAERAQASAAASAVRVSSVTTCGADLDSRTLEVDGTSGAITYGDDFYACDKQYEHYVLTSPLSNLGSVLDGLAHNP
jgi:hypothetical protein